MMHLSHGVLQLTTPTCLCLFHCVLHLTRAAFHVSAKPVSKLEPGSSESCIRHLQAHDLSKSKTACDATVVLHLAVNMYIVAYAYSNQTV